MGIQNIIKNSQEETPSSDSFPQNDPFHDEMEPPLVIEVYTDTSDTESFSELQDADELLDIVSYSTTDESDGELSTAFLPPSTSAFPLEETLENNQSYTDGILIAKARTSETPSIDENKRIRRTKFTKSRKSCMGKKKARRFENARQLAMLATEADQNEYDDNDFMPFECPFRFSQILGDTDLTNKILNATLDDMDTFSNTDFREVHPKKKKTEVSTMKRLSPAEAFNNLDSSQKTFFKRRNLPLGMLQYLDTCVFSFFENNPKGIYISEPLTSFERMMLHSIAHYYKLNSYSFDAEDHVERLTKVTNNADYFRPPCLCLSQYLEEHLWKTLNSGSASKRRRCKRK